MILIRRRSNTSTLYVVHITSWFVVILNSLFLSKIWPHVFSRTRPQMPPSCFSSVFQASPHRCGKPRFQPCCRSPHACVGEAFTVFNNITVVYLEFFFFSGCPGLNTSFEDNKKCLRNASSQGTALLHGEYYLLQIPLKAQYKKLNPIETYKML